MTDERLAELFRVLSNGSDFKELWAHLESVRDGYTKDAIHARSEGEYKRGIAAGADLLLSKVKDAQVRVSKTKLR